MLFAVVEFESLDCRRTKVTLSMPGWGAGVDWDEVCEFLGLGQMPAR
jgi:hypothetical protein